MLNLNNSFNHETSQKSGRSAVRNAEPPVGVSAHAQSTHNGLWRRIRVSVRIFLGISAQTSGVIAQNKGVSTQHS
jgi:hypothetical protein